MQGQGSVAPRGLGSPAGSVALRGSRSGAGGCQQADPDPVGVKLLNCETESALRSLAKPVLYQACLQIPPLLSSPPMHSTVVSVALPHSFCRRQY